MDLDLGEKQVANVKIGGDTFKVSLPSVKQAQDFKDKMDSRESAEFDVFIDFMEELGLPKKVCETLTIAQVTKLSEGLMGDPGKK